MVESRDPRVDPRPGDVVELCAHFVRTVTGRRGDAVEFRSQVGAGLCCVALGPFVDLVHDWRENVADAEVLRAAD